MSIPLYLRSLFVKPQIVEKQAHTFSSCVKELVEFYKRQPNTLVNVCGNLVWVSSPGLLKCLVVKKNGKDFTQQTWTEQDYPPFRSCPINLILHAGPENSNQEWRKSVYDYSQAMNRKIKKGQVYTVLGNSNVNKVLVESITRTNVKGKYGPNNVVVSKLQLGEPLSSVTVDELNLLNPNQ